MQEQILLAGSTEKSRMLLQTLLPPGTNPPPVRGNTRFT